MFQTSFLFDSKRDIGYNMFRKRGTSMKLKNWIKQNKIWLGIYGVIVFLILLFSVLKMNSTTFFLISILLNVFLVHCVVETIKVLRIKWTKKEIIIMIGAILFIYGFYFFSLMNRNFIYYWDYSCYYNIQIETIDRFSQGLFAGIRSLIGSTWGGEYGNFLSFIVQAPFQFTNKTPNAYVGSCIFVFIPYMVVSLSIALKTIIKKLKIEKEDLVFGMTMISFCLFPLLYGTSIYGQPDLFGLFFIFLIVALTIKYNFKRLDIERLVLIFLATYMLFISRRWYVYWIISYYVCYGVPVLLGALKDSRYRTKIIKHIIGYGLICGIIMVGTLFPLLKNIIVNDYSTHYVFYAGGELITELQNQIGHIGIAMSIVLGLGILLGLLGKEYRKITITAIIQILIITFLFTRIQLMGTHHSLTLLPSYLSLLFVFIAFLSIGRRKWIIYSGVLVIMIANFTFSVMGLNNNLYTDIRISTPYQEDYEEIGEVVNWLERNLNEKETAYMITHNNTYNPDKFRNYHMPDRRVEYYLPYGSAIIGVHKFPTELFTAKYVITTIPFEKTSVDGIYEKVFESLVEENKFVLIQNYDMNNGYQILIYERVIEVDEEEIEKYEEALTEESKQFPELYKDVLEDYKKNL